MLEFYHRLAQRLWPWRAVFWSLAAAAVIAFGVGLFGPVAWRGEVLTVAALALALWAVIAGGLVYGLRQPLPAATADMGWWVRLKLRIRRFGLACFALMLSLLVLGAAYATLRVLGMVLQR